MSVSILEAIDRFDLGPESGPGFRISVYQPEPLAPGARLPIVFLTDADLFMGTAAELIGLRSLSGALAPAIVVGIGYGLGPAEMAVRRMTDLSTPLSEKGRAAAAYAMKAYGDPPLGDAGRLLSFILDVLTPEILRRYPAADADHKILAGTSMGGLFALFALIRRHDAFSGLIANSPALFWDDFSLIDAVKALRVPAAPPRVFIGVGSLEQDLAAAGSAAWRDDEEAVAAFRQTRIIDAAREFVDALIAVGVPDAAFEVIPNENHQEVAPLALAAGLRFLLPPTG
jgi:predicted alpha/beta superfamily hydrolase